MFNPSSYLISYPRSGNTWTRYIIEQISKRVTIDEGRGEKTQNPILIKRHDFCGSENKNKGLIVLIRDYREALIRHHDQKPVDMNEVLNPRVSKNKQLSYIDILYGYDQWPADRRLLVYYEDLMMHPEVDILRMMIFLGLWPKKEDQYKSFIEDIETHKQSSIKNYETKIGPSITKGEDLKFHSKNISIDEQKSYDVFLKKHHPEIFFKYLDRYALE